MKICRCEKVKQLRVEADIGADALWCNRCLCNLDIELFALTIPLKQALAAWIDDYGTWIDWKNNGIKPDGVALEQQHNDRGVRLTEQVMLELDGQYQVVFSPSFFAKKYS